MANPLKKNASLLILAALNVIVIGVMQSFAPSLKPYSIIGFEFAGTPEQAHLILNTWRENGVLDSMYFITGFDYLFMVTYSAFFWLSCKRLAEVISGRVSTVFIALAWLQPLAAILDAIENLALYQIMEGSWKPLWPILAAVCATPKFIIVGLAMISCLGGVAYKIIRK